MWYIIIELGIVIMVWLVSHVCVNLLDELTRGFDDESKRWIYNKGRCPDTL